MTTLEDMKLVEITIRKGKVIRVRYQNKHLSEEDKRAILVLSDFLRARERLNQAFR
jgi:hypothetical protein